MAVFLFIVFLFLIDIVECIANATTYILEFVFFNLIGNALDQVVDRFYGIIICAIVAWYIFWCFDVIK